MTDVKHQLFWGSRVAQLGGVVPGYENKQLYLEDEAVPPLKTLDGTQYLEGNTQWQRSVLRMQVFGILDPGSLFSELVSSCLMTSHHQSSTPTWIPIPIWCPQFAASCAEERCPGHRCVVSKQPAKEPPLIPPKRWLITV